MLQFTDGEEGVGVGLTFLRLDRQVIRERGGASRHLERLELTFNIEGDNPGPTEADIVSNRWGWESQFEEGCWKNWLDHKGADVRSRREGMMGTQERGEV